jgi:chaperonin GroEL (HSP60 family)
MHPTVLVRGYTKALEDAVKVAENMSFDIDINDRSQLLQVCQSSMLVWSTLGWCVCVGGGGVTHST